MSTSFVWAPLRAEHPLARALGLRETVHVPFLSVAASAGSAGPGPAGPGPAGPNGGPFGPKDLLYGVLVGYLEGPPTLDMEAIRPRLRQALDGLWRGFSMESLEHAVLSVAADLREGGHAREARAALATGRALLPQSAKVASDFVMDTWALLPDAPPEGRAALWAEIHAAADGLDYDDIMPAVRESIAFMHFAATRCLSDPAAIERVLHEVVFAHVEGRALKVKVKRALEDPAADPAYLYS